jgi:hypothetical protein
VTRGYEALRSQATGGEPNAAPRGLVLLLRSGVAAWLAAWRQLVVPAAHPQPVARADHSPLAPGASGDLAAVLADMALRAHAGVAP